MPETTQIPIQTPELTYFLGKTFTVGSGLIWFALLGVFVVFGLISLALVYHWIRFTLDAKKAAAVILIYLAGAAVLLLMILSSAGYYHLSIV